MNFVPLNCHSHASFLIGLSKPHQIAERCKELGYTACALTDLGNMALALEFHDECTKLGIKPIIGCEFNVCLDISIKDDNYKNLIVLAKNLSGFQYLVRLVSLSNYDENFHVKPRITYDMIDSVDNLIVIEPETGLTHADWTSPPIKIALANSFYCRKEDAIDQRVLLCSLLKTTMKNVEVSLKHTGEKNLDRFFFSDNFHIPSIEELKEKFTDEEIENTCKIADMCESYSFTSVPRLPKFNTVGDISEIEYIRQLCRNNWKWKVTRNIDKEKYGQRVKGELDTIEKNHLAGYFLIVQDYVRWAKSQGWLIGPGRGSVGGSEVAYLLDITTVDSVQHDLLFERFYNEGRNTPGNISLPDIDVDFPKLKRHEVVEYIRKKYGEKRVCHIATFQQMKARASLKEVLRVHEVFDNATIDSITKKIPEESKISDKLEEADEDTTLEWVLHYEPEVFEEYCKIENGKLVGDYAQYFEQAIRLEGTYKSYGRHASALVIADDDVEKICPMIRDSDGNLMAGMNMYSIERLGICKFDILGLGTLDKLMMVNTLLSKGKL
jgi:DNA polymerase-3 subunit alpha